MVLLGSRCCRNHIVTTCKSSSMRSTITQGISDCGTHQLVSTDTCGSTPKIHISTKIQFISHAKVIGGKGNGHFLRTITCPRNCIGINACGQCPDMIFRMFTCPVPITISKVKVSIACIIHINLDLSDIQPIFPI